MVIVNILLALTALFVVGVVICFAGAFILDIIVIIFHILFSKELWLVIAALIGMIMRCVVAVLKSIPIIFNILLEVIKLFGQFLSWFMPSLLQLIGSFFSGVQSIIESIFDASAKMKQIELDAQENKERLQLEKERIAAEESAKLLLDFQKIVEAKELGNQEEFRNRITMAKIKYGDSRINEMLKQFLVGG